MEGGGRGRKGGRKEGRRERMEKWKCFEGSTYIHKWVGSRLNIVI